MLNTLFYLGAILILLILTPSIIGEFSPSLNLVYTCIYFTLVILFFIRHKKITKNWMRFDFIFLIGFTIVHIQIPALASLGIEPEKPELIWINKNIVNFSTWLSVISITIWMWGYSSYKTVNDKTTQKINFQKKTNHLVHDSLLTLTFIFFIITAGPVLFSGIYDGGESWGEGAKYIFLILNALLYLRIIYFFKEISQSSKIYTIFKDFLSNRIFFIIVSSFILIFLLIGDRGPILKILILFFGSYAIFIKPISLKKIIFFILTGALIFTIIGMGRGKDSSTFNNQNIFERGYSSLIDSDSINITGELAGSNRILYMALDSVPEKHPYLYGTTYLVNIAGAFPFLAGIVVNTFDIPLMYRGTSNFFTIISLGNHATWGVGSEVIADIYVNFSIYGVFIIMFLFGRFSAKSFIKANSFNMIYVLIYLCLLMDALSINRGQLLYPLQSIIYLLILHHCFLFINKFLPKK
ncbi:O-antigen polymerase [Advenella sp. RU8]|uniref:O-antigen polymerase n=1 Tax=Advenella sp. RU8 TaxID=3399575 RepID=UPI003AAB5900